MATLNNPGNIRVSADKFQGEIRPSLSGSFKTFKAPEYGYRAMFKILQTYIRSGIDTPKEIIYTWAPPVENNSANYLKFVTKTAGLSETEKISGQDAPRLKKLVSAMAHFEQGKPGNPGQIAEGWQLLSSNANTMKTVLPLTTALIIGITLGFIL